VPVSMMVPLKVKRSTMAAHRRGSVKVLLGISGMLENLLPIRGTGDELIHLMQYAEYNLT
jgi:hypothetical protein